MTESAAYAGPQCPHCNGTLTPDWVRDGTIDCPYCMSRFDARAFHPPALAIRAVEHAGARPEDDTACAYHERNAAVTSCQRCGVFICALCDMNIGTGSYCPQCFERVRNEGALQSAARRYRDYTAMGRLSIFAGIFIWFMMLLTGALAVYYGVKGLKQRREFGRTILGPVLVILFGLGQVAGGITLISVFVYALTKA